MQGPKTRAKRRFFGPCMAALCVRSYMQISDIPAELDEVLYRLDLKKPKMCFMNCYLAVMNTLSNDNFEIHYILGTVTTSDGYTFDHALIKWNGNYYDPTLEPQGLHNSVFTPLKRSFHLMKLFS